MSYLHIRSRDKYHPRFGDNFRAYITKMLNVYLEYPDSEKKKMARRALKELQATFSEEVIALDAPLMLSDFGLTNDHVVPKVATTESVTEV